MQLKSLDKRKAEDQCWQDITSEVVEAIDSRPFEERQLPGRDWTFSATEEPAPSNTDFSKFHQATRSKTTFNPYDLSKLKPCPEPTEKDKHFILQNAKLDHLPPPERDLYLQLLYKNHTLA